MAMAGPGLATWPRLAMTFDWANIWDLGIRTLLDASYKVWASLVRAWPFWAMMAMTCRALSNLVKFEIWPYDIILTPCVNFGEDWTLLWSMGNGTMSNNFEKGP